MLVLACVWGERGLLVALRLDGAFSRARRSTASGMPSCTCATATASCAAPRPSASRRGPILEHAQLRQVCCIFAPQPDVPSAAAGACQSACLGSGAAGARTLTPALQPHSSLRLSWEQPRGRAHCGMKSSDHSAKRCRLTARSGALRGGARMRADAGAGPRRPCDGERGRRWAAPAAGGRAAHRRARRAARALRHEHAGAPQRPAGPTEPHACVASR